MKLNLKREESQMIEDTTSIRKLILNSPNNLEEINLFLENEYKKVLKEIFYSLLILLKNYDQNKKRIEEVIQLLNKLAETSSVEKIKYFKAPIHDLNNKINHNFKEKQKKKIQHSRDQISQILIKIDNRIELNTKTDQKKYLEFLIFQERNISMIQELLESYDNLLEEEDKNHPQNIFASVLKKYLFLDEKNLEEIEYFYHVIILLIHSQYEEKIMVDKEKYLTIIRASKLGYKEHIIRVIDLLDPNFQLSYQEIERRFGVCFDFPNIILQEAEKLQINHQRRVNFTAQECITIDSKSAQCLDDAIYIEKNSTGCYNLYIHITDIPSIVPYNSLLNEESRRRIETLYLRDNNIPLYPNNISNNLCSLLPNCQRNVITYIFPLNSNFEWIENKFKVVPATICCKHKLSYYDVDQMIQNPKLDSLHQMVRQLHYFAKKRRFQNQKKENYRQFENFLNYETHHESLKVDYSPAANIVHESMILVNYSIAKYCKELSIPYIYRKFIIPSDDFIEKQLSKIQKMDPKIKKDKEFLQHLRNSCMTSIYSTIPVYHRGLNLECYSHSTSPARRYADAFGQYLIGEFIFQKNTSDLNIQSWEYRINYLVEHLNEKKKANEVFSSQYNYLSAKKRIKKK